MFICPSLFLTQLNYYQYFKNFLQKQTHEQQKKSNTSSTKKKKDQFDDEKGVLAKDNTRRSDAAGVDAIGGNTTKTEAREDDSKNNGLKKD